MAPAEPEARAHLRAAFDPPYVVDQITDIQRLSGKADAGADHCRLLRIGERRFVEAELRRRKEADADMAHPASEIFVHIGDASDVTGPSGEAALVDGRATPLRVHVGPWVP